jgi:hypothetical protein
VTSAADGCTGTGGPPDDDGHTIDEAQTADRFTVLNDAPIDVAGDTDLLDAAETGRQLAGLVLDSRQAAPFTLAIGAAWGTGQSTLLHAVDTELAEQPGVRTV